MLPDFHLVRHAKAADAAAVAGYLASTVLKSHGTNFAKYAKAIVQVIQRTSAAVNGALGGAGAVTLTIFEWSPGAGRFISTGITAVAGGAGLPITKEFDPAGRILFFHVTGIAGVESATVYAGARALNEDSLS